LFKKLKDKTIKREKENKMEEGNRKKKKENYTELQKSKSS